MDQLRQHYHTAKEIYDRAILKEQKGNVMWNMFVKFLDLKNPQNPKPLMILEDFSIECHVIIQTSPQIILNYKSYFQPWYIFRFQQLKLTGTALKNDNAPKRVYLTDAHHERMIVFDLIKSVEPDRFFFTKSANPAITSFDWETVRSMQELFKQRIRGTTIADLKHLYDTRPKKSAPRIVSFVAQIVEIKQVQNRIIAKVWDSTKPKFEVKLPITQVQVDTSETTVVHGEKDYSLKSRASGRTVNVLVTGDHLVAKFTGKKPKEMVLFYNAKLYETDTELKIFRIEMSPDRIAHPERCFVHFLDESAPLGRSLKRKVDPHSQFDDFEEPSTLASVVDDASSLITYDETELRNQIRSISDFTMFSDLQPSVNYQIKCDILNLFPIEYKTMDLIRMSCSRCKMDDTISNLFPVDQAGLRLATKFFLLEHGKKSSSTMQCPACSSESCDFYFQVIFILRDKTGREDGAHHMFAYLENVYAQRYLQLYPIEVVANQRDEEYAFLSKIEYLKERFSRSNDCYMIIGRNNDSYNIKDIRTF